MITLVLAALIGAALGLLVRPQWLGVAMAWGLAALLLGGAHLLGGLLSGESAHPGLTLAVDKAGLADLSTTVAAGAACGVASILAGLMSWFADKDAKGEGQGFWLPDNANTRLKTRDGRYARAGGMIQERPIHRQAESRIEEILKQ